MSIATRTLERQGEADVAPADPRRTRRIRLAFRLATAVGLLVVLTLVVLGITTGVLASVEPLRAFVGRFGAFAPVAFVLAGAVEAVVPVIPGSGAVLSAPVLFGPVRGVVYAYLATVLGSILVFTISRVLGRDLVVARVPPRVLERYGSWLDDPRFTKWFAIAIAAPFAPDDALCYLAGLTPMRWRTYLLILLVCKPWGVLLYTTGLLALLKVVFPWLEL